MADQLGEGVTGEAVRRGTVRFDPTDPVVDGGGAVEAVGGGHLADKAGVVVVSGVGDCVPDPITGLDGGAHGLLLAGGVEDEGGDAEAAEALEGGGVGEVDGEEGGVPLAVLRQVGGDAEAQLVAAGHVDVGVDGEEVLVDAGPEAGQVFRREGLQDP